jgi:hypothetical protein
MDMEMLYTTRIAKRFLSLNNTWTATFLLTLMHTTKLYFGCIVQVRKEGIQIIEKTMGSVWRRCQDIGRISNLWMVIYLT